MPKMLARLVVCAVIALAVPWTTSAQEPCRFVLGFAALRDMIGADKVGTCLEDQQTNPENGNAEQRTTGGLLVWRKADNFTAFTDGGTTWVNGPNGLQTRPNSERFTWESDSAAPAAQPAPGQPPPSGPPSIAATATPRTAAPPAPPAAAAPKPASPRAAPSGGACPPSHPIKGNKSSSGELIYHVPSGAFYSRTQPEACFAAEADARAAGYRASQR